MIKQKAVAPRAPQLQRVPRDERSEPVYQTQTRNGSACLPCYEELSVGLPHSSLEKGLCGQPSL